MPVDPALRYTEDECHALFAELFPQGVGGANVLRELAPKGWERSPLVALFHPSPERVYEESLRVHDNLERFFASRAEAAAAESGGEKSGGARPEREPPTPPDLEQIRGEFQPKPIDPQQELRELMGMCLWDVFSDNHEVAGPDGRVVDLGSFRASAGFLAEVVNRGMGHPPGAADAHDMERLQRMIGVNSVESLLKSLDEEQANQVTGDDRVYGYMDFYMGTQMVAGRADLSPVYRLIFRRLQKAGCDWTYHFPRLLLVDLRPLRDALKESSEGEDEPGWAEYDPSTAFADEQEDATRDAELAQTRAKMDESHREAVEAARDGQPPTTVAAYRDVFGELPQGWPPEVEAD